MKLQTELKETIQISKEIHNLYLYKSLATSMAKNKVSIVLLGT